jgi:Amt family ammonium transporter
MNLSLPQNPSLAGQRAVLDALPVLIFLERAGRIMFANAAARQTLGLTEAEWSECAVEDVVWGLHAGIAEPQTSLTGTQSGRPFHATLPAKDGHLVSIEGTYSVLDSELRSAVIVAHPRKREQERQPKLIEDVLSSIPEALVIVHSSRVLYTNPSFTRMFGYSADEASGGDLWERLVPESRVHEQAMLEKAVDLHGRARIETVRLNKDGELLDVAILAGPLQVEGASVGYVLSYREIGAGKQAEARLQDSAELESPV